MFLESKLKNLENLLEENKKVRKLKGILKKYNSVLVAFSGGIDSSFLLKAANDYLGTDNVLAVTVKSELIPKKKITEAKKVADSIGARWKSINISVISESNLIENPTDRCYLCKKNILKNLEKIAKEEVINEIIEGTSIEDIKEYRPGIKAIEEFNVKTPLLDAKFTKEEIRKLSKTLGLPTWDKPSFTCLATRFPYGVKLTAKDLKKVEKAENLLDIKNFTQFRVRHHGNIARIEITDKNFNKLLSHRKDIIKEFKKIGYTYVTLDLEGYRSGSMDIEVKNEKK